MKLEQRVKLEQKSEARTASTVEQRWWLELLIDWSNCQREQKSEARTESAVEQRWWFEFLIDWSDGRAESETRTEEHTGS